MPTAESWVYEDWACSIREHRRPDTRYEVWRCEALRGDDYVAQNYDMAVSAQEARRLFQIKLEIIDAEG